ncbi:uncharacterized protein LOC143029631 isoform X1 [Oratosquilla oratoria]|uniref:uncharacterized protein LOC143029631 isoform X1 n=1 Tax=Oratosquilla oratoria TaxID=337810 RepID=UPI003F774308
MMSSPGKEYRREIDAVYPEPLSRLNRVVELHPHAFKRANKKKMNRSGRFRTTPVTFDEIKGHPTHSSLLLQEVDEEVEEVEEESAAASSRSEHDLRQQFEKFMERTGRRRPATGTGKGGGGSLPPLPGAPSNLPSSATQESLSSAQKPPTGQLPDADLALMYNRKARPSI